MNLLHKKLPILVTCQDPGQVADSVRSGSVGPYPINSRVTYTCNNCYVGGGTITCQPNGQWTQTVVCRSKLQLLLWSIPIFYQTFHLYIFNVEVVCITYLSNLNPYGADRNYCDLSIHSPKCTKYIEHTS